MAELFFGNINPNEKLYVRNSGYDKAMQTRSTNEDSLSELLTDEERSLFLNYANAQSELSSIIAIEYFSDGFRLGAKIMLEVLSDTNGCLRDIC
ncbi:MAG: DUF6809 family protein [Bacillota bacterium]